MRRILLFLGMIGCLMIVGCGWGFQRQNSGINHLGNKLNAFSEQTDKKIQGNTAEIRKLRARLEGMYMGSVESIAQMRSALYDFSGKLEMVEEKTISAEEKIQLMDTAIQQFQAKIQKSIQEISDKQKHDNRLFSHINSHECQQLSLLMEDTHEMLSKLFNPYPAKVNLTLPPDVLEGQLVYKVGDLDRLTLDILSKQLQIPLWRLMLMNRYDPSQLLSVRDIILLGPRGTEAVSASISQGFLSHRIGYLNFQKYEIQKNDTLMGIARKFDVNLQSLLRWNPIPNPDKIPEGVVLNIPQLTMEPKISTQKVSMSTSM